MALASDMSFASREKVVSVLRGSGRRLGRGGGPMARLPRQIGRGRALEVLLGSEDIRGDLAEAYGYVNRSLPDAELYGFVDALAARIASFDKWAIANTKRLVNAASLPPDVEIAAGWGRLHGLRSVAPPRKKNIILRPCSMRGFINPETQKIASGPTWPASVAEPCGPERRHGRDAYKGLNDQVPERPEHKLAGRPQIIRKAKAVWHGTGRDGSGSLSSDSGILADTPYSYRTRFENEKGTNPEELIAAAHAVLHHGARVRDELAGLKSDRAHNRSRSHARTRGAGFPHQQVSPHPARKSPEPGRSEIRRIGKGRREKLSGLQGFECRNNARRQAHLNRHVRLAGRLSPRRSWERPSPSASDGGG